MQANRGRDTTPELAVRKLLHSRGLRYRVNMRLDLGSRKVRPDVAFTRARVAVFIDGCYWHSCPEHSSRPKANASFWAAKLERNVARDRADDAALQEAGWLVLRYWEHEPPLDVTARIAQAVASKTASS